MESDFEKQGPGTPRASPPKRVWRLLLGMVAGNAVGAFLCALAYFVSTQWAGSGLAVSVPSLVLIPLSIGLVAAWVWSPLEPNIGDCALHSLSCTLLSLCFGVALFQEGAICLIILSPMLYASILAGVLLGRILYRRDRGRLNLWIAPALALTILIEPSVRGSHQSVVVDEIQIAAPPAAVWPHVLAFEPIPDPPAYWLFRLGLPYPTETTNGGNFVGADRACRFSGGAVFQERIVEFVPGRRLTFDIVEMPPDPELMGHLDAYRGQFELRDNGDGTTTLIGRTWYSLHVRPAAYFDWWTHEIFGAVHQRVMRNVKRLAEARP